MNDLMSTEALQHALANLPAPHVTKEAIEKRIETVAYIDQPYPCSTLTICIIKLDNGFSVRGESACVDPANYRQDIGRKLAYEDAFKRLWPLFGFLLAECLHVTRSLPAGTHAHEE